MNTNQISISSRLVNILYYPLSYVYKPEPKKSFKKSNNNSNDEDYEMIDLPNNIEENNLEILKEKINLIHNENENVTENVIENVTENIKIDKILIVNNNIPSLNKDDIKFYYFNQNANMYQEYNIYVNDDDIDYDKVIKFDETKLKQLKTIVESEETTIEEIVTINEKENIDKKYTFDDEIDKFLDKLINLFS